MSSANSDFIESFAISTEREKVLADLIEGSEDYFYYSTLNKLNKLSSSSTTKKQLEDLQKAVKDSLSSYQAKFTTSSRLKELQTRFEFLQYDLDPTTHEKFFTSLKKDLSPRLSHEKERDVFSQPGTYPNKFDESQIEQEKLIEQKLKASSYLDGFRFRSNLDTQYLLLKQKNLSPEQLRTLMSVLSIPDDPDLPQKILSDLKWVDRNKRVIHFGNHRIHNLLTLEQLDKLRELKPDLIDNSTYITMYLDKLQPSDDVDKTDEGVREEYLKRVKTFVMKLSAGYNSYKVTVLFRLLENDLLKGKYDKDLFMEYLGYPRNTNTTSRTFLKGFSAKELISFDTPVVGGVRSVSAGEERTLVEDYLCHFFIDAKGIEPFDKYFESDYLKILLSTTKLLNGIGKQSEWTQAFEQEGHDLQELKERVEISFEKRNKTRYHPKDDVKLFVSLKNISTLIVKVFEINTTLYYKTNGIEVSSDINLDGLVSNDEKVYKYSESSMMKVEREFDFPSLKNKRGIFVIEFIGGGKSSRAVIRKGYIHALERTSIAGHIFKVFDEDQKPVKDVELWMEGTSYTPNENLDLVVPYSNSPTMQTFLLTHQGFSTLNSFSHQSENFHFSCPMYIDRETLIKGSKSKVIAHPRLTVNGELAPLNVIEDITLTIVSSDSDGTESKKVVSDFKLESDKDSVYEFQVPEKLRNLSFTVSGKVKKLSTGTYAHLSASENVKVNSIDDTQQMTAINLLKNDQGYKLQVLGKTGEAISNEIVRLNFNFHHFSDSHQSTLQTDQNGELFLGALNGVSSFRANDRTFDLSNVDSWYNYPDTIHANEGEKIEIPFFGSALERSQIALFELRGNKRFYKDRFGDLSLSNNLLTITNLTPGDYQLHLKQNNTTLSLSVTKGTLHDRFIVGPKRVLRQHILRNPFVQISSTTIDSKHLKITLTNPSSDTRVHIIVSHFVPSTLLHSLGSFSPLQPPILDIPFLPKNEFLSPARTLGDEYQYILDRKYAKKRPGNTLSNPSLLLNPWQVQDTVTIDESLQHQKEYLECAPSMSACAPSRALRRKELREREGKEANLDFLSAPAVVILNLKADVNGVISVPVEELGNGSFVRVLALNGFGASFVSLGRKAKGVEYRDLRLDEKTGLDPKVHLVEHKKVSTLWENDQFGITDIFVAKVEFYDSLRKVFGLYSTFTKDVNLKKFEWILDWHDLSEQEQRDKFSEFTCHELNYFLYKKDPVFFEKVVAPFLQNKKEKKFLDHYLLGNSLEQYSTPHRFVKLNVFEKILLGQREGSESVKNHLQGLAKLAPPDSNRFNTLFDTAIAGSALETDRLAAPKSAALQSIGFGGGGGGGGMVKKSRKKTSLKKEKKMALYSRAQESEDIDDLLADLSYDGGLREGMKTQQLYRAPEKTKEYAENHYYHLPMSYNTSTLVALNPFWCDFVASDPKKPFLSSSFMYPHSSFTEMIFALSVLDLPLSKPPQHDITFKDFSMNLVPKSPMILCHKEIKESDLKLKPILVSQNFFDPSNAVERVDGEIVEKYVTEEFLINKMYGCRVILTNVSSSNQPVDVLLQIPVGALPLNSGFVTKSKHVVLQGHQTHKIEYFFYFPKKGVFNHFPIHSAKNQMVVAFASPVRVNVVEKLSKVDTKSWNYVSQNESDENVLKFMKEGNIQELDIHKILFRVKDVGFFDKVIQILRDNRVYNHSLWGYSLLHLKEDILREYLEFTRRYKNHKWLQTKLVNNDPILDNIFEHLEYKPFVNARTHQLGNKRKILNNRFDEQYKKFLDYLCYKDCLNNSDLMALVYYLLLQDRIDEAQEYFGKIKCDEKKGVEMQLQFDYLTAYLDFYNSEPSKAFDIAEKYKDYPVTRWNKLFAEVRSKLNELKGGDVEIVDDDSRDQEQAKLASATPSLDFNIEAKKISVDYQNLSEIVVSYFKMDIELLFSTSPFVKDGNLGHFSHIQPNLSQKISLEKGKDNTIIPIPEEFHNCNVMVDISGSGVQKTESYYSNSLAVNVIRNRGILKVKSKDTRKPLPQVYVKVYSKSIGGNVAFYKDGYTDLVGCFDFVSVMTDALNNTELFSILIMSEENGSLIKEVKPPKM